MTESMSRLRLNPETLPYFSRYHDTPAILGPLAAMTIDRLNTFSG